MNPRQEMYSDVRDPAMQSMTYPIVIEVAEFRRRDLPRMMYTTHIRIWVKGKITRILELNGYGGEECERTLAKQAILEFSEKTDIRMKSYKHTQYGDCWAFKCNVNTLLGELDDLAEAVFKPNAKHLVMLAGLIEK